MTSRLGRTESRTSLRRKLFRDAGLILGSVAIENARVAHSIAFIRDEWRRMRDKGPTQADLDLAKEARVVAHRLLDPDGLRFAVAGDPTDLTATRTVPDSRL